MHISPEQLFMKAPIDNLLGETSHVYHSVSIFKLVLTENKLISCVKMMEHNTTPNRLAAILLKRFSKYWVQISVMKYMVPTKLEQAQHPH